MATLAMLVNLADVMLGMHCAGLTNMYVVSALRRRAHPCGAVQGPRHKHEGDLHGVIDYNVKLEESLLIN